MTSLLLYAILAADTAPEIISYEGKLSQMERGKPTVAVKEFSAQSAIQPAGTAYEAITLVTETASQLPWAEQLSRQSNVQAAQRPVAIGYRHDERMYVIPAMFPLLSSPEPLREGLKWTVDSASFEVTGQEQVGKTACWVVQSVTGPARRHQILVRTDAPIVESLRQTVFMGQGDRFELVVNRKESVTPNDDDLARNAGFATLFLDLQSQLQRDEHDRSADLTEEQVGLAAKQSGELVAKATGSMYERFAKDVQRAIDDRTRRADKVAELAGKFVGQSAPGFVLTRLNGDEIDLAALKGKVVILHFWGYQDEPLEQPYGQIGYLDFLANRYKDQNIAVYGVAVDPQLATPLTRDTAVRSIRRLTSFMKTSYEVTLDTKSVLTQFGNPTRLGVELPLWVVIDPAGKIAHYHVGYHSIDNARGLHTLDELVQHMLKE